MPQHSGDGLDVHPVLQGYRGECVPLWHNKDKSENPCVATGWRFAPVLFPLKNGPKTGAAGGGEKPGLHLKDKFSRAEKKVKNGFLGHRHKKRYYGLDLLGGLSYFRKFLVFKIPLT